jgi:hypothetical protein
VDKRIFPGPLYSRLDYLSSAQTDKKDAEWIAELLQLGLLKPSFIPSRFQRNLRQVTRLRTTLTQERTRLINRLHCPNFRHHWRTVSYVTTIPRWARSSSTSRKLSEKRKESQTA